MFWGKRLAGRDLFCQGSCRPFVDWIHRMHVCQQTCMYIPFLVDIQIIIIHIFPSIILSSSMCNPILLKKITKNHLSSNNYACITFYINKLDDFFSIPFSPV